jgi:integrase
VRDRRVVNVGESISEETKLAELVRLWLVDLRAEVAAGVKAPGTGELYETTARRVVEGLGELRLREVTVGRADRFIAATQQLHGPVSAKRAKTVLNGVMGLAARHDAIRSNPIRDTRRIRHGERKTAAALDLDQVRELRKLLAADQKAQDWDLVEFVDLMLATGKRIGETAALTWDAIDLDAGTVEIRGTVVRIKGHGLVIKPRPKTKAGFRKLRLPSWAVVMLRRRAAVAEPNPWGVVFTSPLGMLRDPSNTQADLREVFGRLGYGWLTSHVFRKTAATAMDYAHMSARMIADQLGQAQVSVTQDVYLGRKIASEEAARALEVFGDDSGGGQP